MIKKSILIKKTTKTLRTPLNVGSLTIDNDVIVRDHCHTAGKYRGSAHGDCNINLKSNHKIHVVFNNLKNYDSHFVIQELGKFNLFNLSSSLDSFVKNSKKDNFKYLSQEFDNNILDLVKQKGLYPYDYMILRKNYLVRKKFIVC